MDGAGVDCLFGGGSYRQLPDRLSSRTRNHLVLYAQVFQVVESRNIRFRTGLAWPLDSDRFLQIIASGFHFVSTTYTKSVKVLELIRIYEGVLERYV